MIKLPTLKAACLFLAMSFALLACDDKKENIEKVSTAACQDTRDMLEAHVNSLPPIMAKILMKFGAKEEIQNGAICDCLLPSAKKHLETLPATELEAMLNDKSKRGQAIKKALADNSNEIFACYESKGLKGMSLIKDFIKKIVR